MNVLGKLPYPTSERGKSSSKVPFKGDMLVPRRVDDKASKVLLGYKNQLLRCEMPSTLILGIWDSNRWCHGEERMVYNSRLKLYGEVESGEKYVSYYFSIHQFSCMDYWDCMLRAQKCCQTKILKKHPAFVSASFCAATFSFSKSWWMERKSTQS